MQTSTITGKWALTVVVLCCYSLAGTKANSVKSLVPEKKIHNLENTSHIDDYVIQNQRQYAANIIAMDNTLGAFKVNYQKQLESIEEQSKLLEANVQQAHERLAKLGTVSDLSKSCVQKYQPQLAPVASVKSDIAGCVSSAENTFASIVAPANTTKHELENYYKSNLTSMINVCKPKNVNTLKYTTCMVQAITDANSATASYQRTFNAQMETASAADNQPLGCAYAIVYNTVSRIGEVTQQIDNCNLGNELRAANNSSCQYTYKQNTKSTYYKAYPIITNPLYGLNDSIPCLRVVFSKE